MKHHGFIKTASAFTALLAALSLLGACEKGKKAAVSYTDGVYTGKSSVFSADESGNGSGYGEVELEIKENRVVACTFRLYEPDGALKDESYGAGLSAENRRKAQKAVQSADKYADLLVKNGSLDGVDAISGATISFEEFKEAVNDALQKAAQ